MKIVAAGGMPQYYVPGNHDHAFCDPAGKPTHIRIAMAPAGPPAETVQSTLGGPSTVATRLGL